MIENKRVTTQTDLTVEPVKYYISVHRIRNSIYVSLLLHAIHTLILLVKYFYSMSDL